MPNQSGKVVLIVTFFLLLMGLIIYFFSPNFRKQEYSVLIPNSSIGSTAVFEKATEPPLQKNNYDSKDLKISLEYPSSWIMDDRYFEILIANFETNLNSNKTPKSDEIEIIIHNARGCHKTIDENLKDPACGEGGSNIKPNEILSKDTEDLDGVKFYKYLIKYPSGKEQKFYFLEKGNRVLQIDKKPDPSMFEKEFEGIIRSIKFN